VNLGIGGAFQAGLLYAARSGVKRLVRLDGDGQHDPAAVSALLDALDTGGADLVIGSRFLAESGGYRSTVTRRMGIRLISALNRMVTGKRIHDCTSGFLAMSGSMIAYLADVVPDDYPEPELLVLASRAGFEVTEVAIRMRPRGGGESSIRLADSALYMLKVILAILVSATKKPKGQGK
jgi:glycosyltransferase involved in cell wall biosynthesis